MLRSFLSGFFYPCWQSIYGICGGLEFFEVKPLRWQEVADKP